MNLAKSPILPCPQRRGGAKLVLLVFLALLGGGGWYGYETYRERAARLPADALIVSEVVREPFNHTIIEQGEIESSSNTDVLCEIEARGNAGTAILWVIEEGARVRKGDKLVELDSSNLELELKVDRIEVLTAEASVATSAALLEQATISRQEYLEGIFLTEESAILSEIATSEQELRKSQLARESTERLVAKGLVNALQLEADKYALINTRNLLDAAKGRLRVLQELTKRKMLVQFDSDIEVAKVNLSAAKEKLLEEQTELDEIKIQIEKCLMIAPTDGVVVHANKYSSRGGSAEFVVEAGAIIRERQSIIQLPDPSKMQVRCKVNESRITLLKKGMAAKIRIDALPSMELKGHVSKVNRYAEPGSWFSSSIKEYAVVVEIVDPPEVIRTGMTASVEVFIEQLPEATLVPIQAIYEHDKKMFALVKNGPQKFETRQVKISATNDTMANISEGLNPGEQAVLNLREHLSLMNLPDVIKEDNSDMVALPQSAIPQDALPPGDEQPAAGGRPGVGTPGGGQPGTGQPGGTRPGSESAKADTKTTDSTEPAA